MNNDHHDFDLAVDAIGDTLDLFAEELPEQSALMPMNSAACAGTASSAGGTFACAGTFSSYS